jgi:hypothetical protein
MLNKFNLPSLNNYCQTFAQNVCQDFYSKHSTATGKDLLDLTLIQQVNLFVVKGVYEKWKSDTEAFRSPYFNFEAANVQQSLQSFMNVVSQNIAVGREHLEPLLTTAVYESLILLLDPQAYFNEIFRSLPDFRVTPQITKQLQKYTRWNAFLAQAAAEQIGDKEAIYVNEAISSVEENLI